MLSLAYPKIKFFLPLKSKSLGKITHNLHNAWSLCILDTFTDALKAGRNNCSMSDLYCFPKERLRNPHSKSEAFLAPIQSSIITSVTYALLLFCI